MRAIGRHLSATEASKATTRRASSSASLLLGKSNKKAIQKKQKQNHVAVTVTPPLIHQHQHQLYRSQHCHRHRSFEISHRAPAVPFRFMSSTTTNTSSTAQPSTSPTSSATSTSVESAGSGVIDISHKQSTAEERRLLNSFFLPELQHSYASASPLPAPLNYTAMYESSPNPSTSASSLSIDHDTSFSSSSSSSASSSSSSSPLHRQGSNTQEQSHTDHTFSPLTYGKDRLIAPTLVITDVSMPVNLSTLRTSASYQITKQVSNYFAAVLEAEADINVEDVRLVVVDAKTLSTDRLFDVYMVFNDQQIAKQVDYLLKTKGVVVYGTCVWVHTCMCCVRVCVYVRCFVSIYPLHHM